MKTTKTDLRNFVNRKVNEKRGKILSSPVKNDAELKSKYNQVISAIKTLGLAVSYAPYKGYYDGKNDDIAYLSFNSYYRTPEQKEWEKNKSNELDKLEKLKSNLMDKIDLYGADETLVQEIQDALA